MIQPQIVVILSADESVSSLAGSRIYPLRIPQRAVLPAVVYQKIGVTPINSLDGDSGLDIVRLQVSCWAQTYAQAADLASAVRQALTNAPTLKCLTEFEIDGEDQETKSFRIITDFTIWSNVIEGFASASFVRVEMTGDGVTTDVDLESAIAVDGFLMVTINGRMGQEGELFDYTVNEARNKIVFNDPPAGAPNADEVLVIYQPVSAETDVSAQFERVHFEGTGSNTEISLSYPILANGFYLVTLNGRIVKEGVSATFTINEDRTKIIFNSPLAGGSYKDEGLIIYQKA